MEFIRSVVGASTSLLMFNRDKDDDFEKLKQKLDQQRQLALDALTKVRSKYSPATKEDADTYFTTAEISNAVVAHTGTRLENTEIFDLMNQLKYTYETTKSLEFNWLLKKE
jgi:hypothetical protein